MDHLILVSLNNDPTEELGTKHAGGQTKYILELSKNLLFRGCTVDIFTIGSTEQRREEEIVPGVRVLRFQRTDGRGYDYDIEHDELDAIAMDIAEFVRVSGIAFDAILCCYWTSGPAALAIREVSNKPIAVTFCQLAAFKRVTEDTEQTRSRFAAEKRLGDLCDRVIATNNTERKTLIDEYGISSSKIRMVPRGIDLDVFHP